MIDITAVKLSWNPKSNIEFGFTIKIRNAAVAIIFHAFGLRFNTGANIYKLAIIEARITLGLPPERTENRINPNTTNNLSQPHLILKDFTINNKITKFGNIQYG